MPLYLIAERLISSRISRIAESTAWLARSPRGVFPLRVPFRRHRLGLLATLLLLAPAATRAQQDSRSGFDRGNVGPGTSSSYPSGPTKSPKIDADGGVVELSSINSPARDNTPLITADGRIMFFNSTRRSDRSWAHYNGTRDRYDDDIYYAVRSSEKGEKEVWSTPANLGSAINSSADDGVAAISPDGHRIYFVSLKKGWAADGGPFYRADLQGTSWSNVQGMGSGIARFFQHNPAGRTFRVYGASISPDGRDFYFATTAHSEGDRQQIWISHNIGGQWSDPENLGSRINQPAGSYAPFIAADGRTLFFSTHMAGGFGGDDIYYSTLRNGIWETPLNIGAPINTANDDAFLSIPASGDRVYLSTSHNGNDDIYSTALPESARPKSVVLLTGTVANKRTGAPVEATVTIEDLDAGTKIFDARSDSLTGTYTAILYAGKRYGISVNAPGYVFLSTHYTTPNDGAYAEIHESFPLEKLEEGKSFVLNNIFFEYKLATISAESKLELNRLIDLLNTRGALKITVDGFTDNIGSDEFNHILSIERAAAVRNYLVDMGHIAPARIEVRGYGIDRPVASNDTEDGRRKNRRVEFSVLQF